MGLTTSSQAVDHDIIGKDVELLLVLSLYVGSSGDSNPVGEKREMGSARALAKRMR